MKFFSKNTNLRIILKPGLPAQPVLGIPAVGSVSVKFQDGLAEVKDQKIIDKMLRHPAYNVDFIAVDDEGDPFSSNREEIEPGHVITEMKYGHAERSIGTPKKVKIPAEMQAAIMELANEMANKRMKEMLPGLLEDTLKNMAQISADKKAENPGIASVEGDSSLLDDTIEITQEDVNAAEEVELTDEELGMNIKNAEIKDAVIVDNKKKTTKGSAKK